MKEDRLNFHGLIPNLKERKIDIKKTLIPHNIRNQNGLCLKAGARKAKVRVHYWILKDLGTGRETESHGQFVTRHSHPQMPRDVEKKGEKLA